MCTQKDTHALLFKRAILDDVMSQNELTMQIAFLTFSIFFFFFFTGKTRFNFWSWLQFTSRHCKAKDNNNNNIAKYSQPTI